MKNRTFSLYSSGVPQAAFRLEEGKVFYRTRDRETLGWDGEEEKELTKENTHFVYPQEIPVYDVLRKILDRTSPRGLGSGYVFHKNASCQAGGKTAEALVYAQKEGTYPIDYIFVGDEIVGAVAALYKKESVLIEDGREGLTPLAFYMDGALSKPVYGVKTLGTFMVEMRDGVKLSTFVLLPRGGPETERFPAVLVRTCYGKPRELPTHLFAHYGYAVVIQDTRGREDSEGEFRVMIDEVPDGEDTLNWLSAQPWFSGSAGMIGASSLAFSQWAAASSGHPALKALISQATGSSPFLDFPHRNGILCAGVLAWMFSMCGGKIRDPKKMNRTDWDEVLKTRPVKSIPEKYLGEKPVFWDEWMEHTVRDEYWNRANVEKNADKVNVPTLYVSGWYDDANVGTSHFWRMNRGKGRANQKLIIGPWKHQYNSSRDIHGINFGADAVRHDLFSIYLRWYDRFLKGIKNDAEALPAVSYYTIHENLWRKADGWPLPEAREQVLYLNGENANGGEGGGTLTQRLGTGSDEYAFDPLDAAPHLIDVCENECAVPENYKEVEKRRDVLCYTTEAMKEDTYLIGEPLAVLYAASDAVDTDFVVRLTELYENGDSIRLSDGVVRARFRNSLEKEELLVPGEIVKYIIPMSWIGILIKKGNRLRLEVTSGMENLLFTNHNTGGSFATDTEFKIANQKVFHDGQHSSHVVLPIVPKGQLRL